MATTAAASSFSVLVVPPDAEPERVHLPRAINLYEKVRDDLFPGKDVENVTLGVAELDMGKDLGGKMPWEVPGFEPGEDDLADDAYGRREIGNWEKRVMVLVDEYGRSKGLPINEGFRSMPVRGGHLLRGTVVVYAVLVEHGCGDSVKVDAPPIEDIRRMRARGV
jgi:hypothetical protein